MKKHILTILLVMLGLVTFGQQWTAISGNTPSKYQVALVASSERNITVDLQLSGFFTSEVTTPQGQACIVSLPKTVSVAAAGEPNLPMIPIPTIIGDRALMGVQVISAEYTDYPNMEIAPSKGDFPRSINPDDVPYTYGEAYQHDAFFPAQLVELDEPYIHRDVRGQNMMVTPCQYNPITKVLRVYHHLVLSMDKIGYDTRNIIETRSNTLILDPDFKATYENRYINYEASMSRYTAIEEAGELLVICYDNFMSAMEPFVAWKKQIGRPTTMVGTSTAGSSNSAIKSYITSYYNQHPNLTDVLLVGDVAQIPGASAGGGSYSGKGDNPYGQVAGSDRYNDVIIGRFCCETAAQVTNHVNKVINYERDLNASATWLPIGQGISTTAGTGGHYNEDDYVHVDNLRTDLLNYNYTNVYRDYQSVSGTTATSASVVSQHINGGVSIINYCNHGSETSWGVFSYSNSHVNALTNDYKLPFVFSVACLVGKYDYSGSGGCFAEAWMRATNNSNGNPTGAIGGMFSYISQPWVPPMYGQDEMVDILVETYSNRIRRTMGGVSINGIMSVLDLGASQAINYGTYETWILYGDPTLTLRNAVPQNMGVTHAPTMYTDATSFAVNATNGNGALATLTRNGEIMGSATITNGSCNITFTAPGSTGTATLTVFGYNKITYIADINIVGGGTQYYNVSVMANPTDGGIVSGDGGYQAGQSCTVTATPNSGYTFTNWMENGNVVSTNASYTFTVTGNHYLTANFQAQPQTYTIAVSANPTNGGTVTGGGTYQQGQQCTVSATPNANYTFTNWTENGNVVSTNASYTFDVNANRSLVANFTYVAPTYTVSVSANPSNGGSVSGGGTYQQGQSCTVSATPATGYTFTNWTEGGNVVSTNASYSFNVTGNRNLVANFTVVPQEYTISVSAQPTNGGNVTGGGTYTEGQSCTVNATANAGYTFSNWTENGTVVSTNASYTFNVTGNRNLVANFTLNTYTVTVTAQPTNGGSVTGGGTFNYGQNCTVSAMAATGFAFANWTENGTVVSTNAHYTFTVNANRTLVANFTANTYTINVSASPTAGGTVTGGGSFTYGQSCTVTATAATGYSFTNWTENGNVVSTNANYTFTVNANRTLVAHFTANTYTVSVSANPAAGGTFTGGGTFTYGQSCTVVATPNANYTFNNWTQNGNVVSTNASYTFTVNANRTLVANFTYVAPPTNYTVTVSANPTEGGTVTGGGTYQEGQTCTVEATTNVGYNFINWTENGVEVSASASYTFTVTANLTLVANYEVQTVKINVTVDPMGGGLVTGNGTYNYGEQVTLSITPAEFFTFINWTENGVVVSEEPTFTFQATENHDLVVHLLNTQGIAENAIQAMVYPNPTKGDIIVECEGLSHVRIVNAFGQTVYNADLEGDKTRIDLSQMAKGIYMMHLEAAGGQTVRKIVVE